MIEISCHNYKLDAFWSGEWLTTFTLQNGVLSGDLKIRCHYFEMGNMQFNLDKTFDSIPCANTSDAATVIKSISQVENKVSSFFLSSNFYFFLSIKCNLRRCTVN